MDEEENITDWHQAFEAVEPYIVKIITPQGSGTGFLMASTSGQEFHGIATAAHVIDFAHYWEQPIRIQHIHSGEVIFLKKESRSIDISSNMDSATIVIKGKLPFLKSPPTLIPEDKRLMVGVEIGWMGFPAIAPDNLCFFSGRISSWVEDSKFYFVDGVAINGVSGGPAFQITPKKIFLIGLVSAYVPNRATGAALPGLCVVRSVSQLYKTIKDLKSFEDAKSKEKPLESPPPSPSISAE